MISSFTERVLAATRRIPSGKVATYQDIARATHAARAVRAVGNALNSNPDTKKTPCHRVVRSDGMVGGYGRGTPAKIQRLRAEGVVIVRGRVDLARYRAKL